MITLDRLHQVTAQISDGFVDNDVTPKETMLALLAILSGDVHLSDSPYSDFIYVGLDAVEAFNYFVAECRADGLDYSTSDLTVRMFVGEDLLRRSVHFTTFEGSAAYRGTSTRFIRAYVHLTDEFSDIQAANMNILPLINGMEDWVAV